MADAYTRLRTLFAPELSRVPSRAMGRSPASSTSHGPGSAGPMGAASHGAPPVGLHPGMMAPGAGVGGSVMMGVNGHHPASNGQAHNPMAMPQHYTAPASTHPGQQQQPYPLHPSHLAQNPPQQQQQQQQMMAMAAMNGGLKRDREEDGMIMSGNGMGDANPAKRHDSGAGKVMGMGMYPPGSGMNGMPPPNSIGSPMAIDPQQQQHSNPNAMASPVSAGGSGSRPSPTHHHSSSSNSVNGNGSLNGNIPSHSSPLASAVPSTPIMAQQNQQHPGQGQHPQQQQAYGGMPGMGMGMNGAMGTGGVLAMPPQSQQQQPQPQQSTVNLSGDAIQMQLRARQQQQMLQQQQQRQAQAQGQANGQVNSGGTLMSGNQPGLAMPNGPGGALPQGGVPGMPGMPNMGGVQAPGMPAGGGPPQITPQQQQAIFAQSVAALRQGPNNTLVQHLVKQNPGFANMNFQQQVQALSALQVSIVSLFV